MESRWVSGAYRPRGDEVVERNLAVTGELPRALLRRLVRIIPNPLGSTGPDHEWFAAAGMAHAVRLGNGRALEYRDRRDASSCARIGIPRRERLEDPVDWIEFDPCQVFHKLNAYHDADDGIVLDLVRLERFNDQDRTGRGDPCPPSLYRSTSDAVRTRLTDASVEERLRESPRLDERFFTQRHRFGDTTQLFDAEARSGVLLHDFVGADSAHWLAEPGERVSEVVFVPRSEGALEGERWLLGLPTGGSIEGAELLVFEAEALAKGPIARVANPHRIPADVHGSWIPASAIGTGSAR